METIQSCGTNATAPVSPWGKISSAQASNLSDIMSEEVARDLQQKEFKKVGLGESETSTEISETPPKGPIPVALDIEPSDHGTENFVSDIEIARILQQQFDREHDDELKKKEQQVNGPSKVSISFENYRRVPLNDDFESDSEEEEPLDPRDLANWDRFDSVEREYQSMSSCGFKVQPNGVMVTKHDTTMNGRMNACKLMNLPPDFKAGDGAGFDLQISNKVFNSLRSHSKQAQSRRKRMRDKREDEATAEFGIDEFTRIILYKLINRQILKQVNGVISIGKEAVVLHGDTDPEYEGGVLPEECVIKVFKTTLSEYKQRDKYIRNDYRFKDRFGKQNTRGMVQLWAEKEMRNLRRLERAKIPCPTVIIQKSHLLVMSFIGKDHRAAPKLKNVTLSAADWIIAYDEVVKYMKILYSDANLIHADLSEYNLLWFEDTVYFIDVSQAVEPCHENAFVFLHRDCCNISKFFTTRGVPDVATPDDLFIDITGCNYKDKIALSELEQNFKLKPHHIDIPGKEAIYKFDTAWERSTPDRVASCSSDVASEGTDDGIVEEPALIEANVA